MRVSMRPSKKWSMTQNAICIS